MSKNSKIVSKLLTAQSIKIENSYYLMNQSFYSGCFYNILKNLKNDKGEYLYDCVLALDFGDGQTTAAAMFAKNLKQDSMKKAKKWVVENINNDFLFFDTKKIEIEPEKLVDIKTRNLNFIDSSTYVIPSMIGFNGDQVIIGKQAKNCSEFYPRFKEHPGNWGQNIGGGKTHRDLMLKFFEEVFKQIINNSANADIEKSLTEGKLLICVGCPTSDEWLNSKAKNEYADLVREALDPIFQEISDKDDSNKENEENKKAEIHVEIVAESTASLMTGMLGTKKKKEIDIGKGILIVDIGSLTTDVTYIKAGDIIMTGSKKLGGRNVDNLIFKAILENQGLTNENIREYGAENGRINYYDKCLVDIRVQKEDFYESERQHNQPIPIAGKSIDFNNSFMTEKVWNSADGKNLLKELRSFIGKIYKEAVLHGCESILISGGTAKIDEFREAIEEEVNEINNELNPTNKITVIPPDKQNTSLCVAVGICLTKKIEYMGELYLWLYTYATYKIANKQYRETIKSASEKMPPVIVPCIESVAQKFIQDDKDITDKEFVDEVMNVITGSQQFNNCMDQISAAMLPHLNDFNKECEKVAKIVADGIYKKDFSFVVNPTTNINIKSTGDVNPYRIAVEKALKELLLKKTLISLAMALGYVDNYIHGESAIGVKFRKDAQDMLMKFRSYWEIKTKPKKLKKVLSKINRSDFIKNFADELYKEIMDCEYFTKIIDYYQLNAEAILGKVMLEVYDNPPKAIK